MPKHIQPKTIQIAQLTLQGYSIAGIAQKLGARTSTISMARCRLYKRAGISLDPQYSRQALLILKTAKRNALDALKNDLCPYPDTPCKMRGKKHETKD